MASIILTDAVNIPVLQLNLQTLERVRIHSILQSYCFAFRDYYWSTRLANWWADLSGAVAAATGEVD
jgi:uncharacterized membrane protein